MLSTERWRGNGGLSLFAFPSTALRIETRRMRGRQMYYAIRVKGHLDPSWQDRFGGLCIEQQENGTTLFLGILPDQAALHGVLLQIIRLGLTLLSLETSEVPNETGDDL
jgi:hypothetical protein